MEKLVRIRANYKGQITSFIKYVESWNADNFDAVMAKVRYDNFMSIRDKIENVQIEIELLVSEKSLTEQYVERENFNSEIFKADVLYRKRMVELNNVVNNSLQIARHEPKFKLPTVEVPQFDGDIIKYRSFRNVFDSIVHDNEQLSNVHKFVYLRSALTGEAAGLISSMEINDDNYEEALDILDTRFNNKRSCVQAHLKLIFEHSCIKVKNVSALRKLIDDFVKNLAALKTLGEPTEHWDSVLVYILLGKLDTDSRELFEISFKEPRMPTVDELLEFLQSRCVSYESLGKETRSTEKVKGFKALHTAMPTSEKLFDCVLGHKGHKIFKCPEFHALNPSDRFELAKKHKLCINCLGLNHTVKDCTFRNCLKCGRKHNVLLHFENKNNVVESGQISAQEKNISDQSSGSALHSVLQSSNVLLYTATLRVKDRFGRFNCIRGVVDPGSQVNVVTESAVRRLGLRSRPATGNIDGFGRSSKTVSEFVEVIAFSNTNNYSFCFQAFVVPEITEDLPRNKFEKNESFENIRLADSLYNVPSRIEFLLSNAIYTLILKSGLICSGDGKLKAVNTELGYLIGGLNFSLNKLQDRVALSVLFDAPNVEDQIEKFWEIENVPVLKSKSEPDECERFFVETTIRDSVGRFLVKLPFRVPNFDFSFSRQFALARFRSLECKFRKNPEYKNLYVEFMHEYYKLSHMSLVSINNMNDPSAYYIPHHGVFKTNDGSSKIRVVFDGSSCPDQTTSLNKVLFVGPKLQNDIVAILVRFRFYKFCFVADIEKMYRKILVQEEHRKFQRILWRDNEDDMIREFELSTVTYGLTSSPYLALRCLRQLATESAVKYPEAARIINDDFFVDDVVSGFDTIEEGHVLLEQLIEILRSADFSLHKWNSNSSLLIRPFTESFEDKVVDLLSDAHRVLGILWRPLADKLSFSCKFEVFEKVTKRSILSQLAGIFDPLGLISPCVILGKLLMQNIWKIKLNWDDEVPTELKNQWHKLITEMNLLNNFHVDRFVGISLKSDLQFVGFSDASARAYGSCIYIKVDGSLQLLLAKSRVAPIQNWRGISQEISVARLELLGALTLSRLAKYIKDIFRCTNSSFHLYTDSKIVLCWLSKPPSTWKPFIANRVCEIQNEFPIENWSYVPTELNPADIISRGCYPGTLINEKLWWRGPVCFNDDRNWGITNLEIKKSKPVVLSLSINFLYKFSSYLTSIHVFAYIIRFVKNCRLRKIDRHDNLMLSPDEIQHALLKVLYIVQNMHFSQTISKLEKSKSLSGKDPLSSLRPFLDEFKMLRVGGRLVNACIPYSAMHPIILPKSDHFVHLIIEYEHRNNQHANVDTLVTLLRQRYWIVNARSIVRKIVRRCYRCFRAKPIIGQQLMGDLPPCRVELMRPFLKIGIDYCGPFNVRPNRRRGNSTFICYVAIFVCFATKAVHVEVVQDLTTESFVATFRRFVARRGKPLEVWSDNATNFVGANQKIQKINDFEIKMNKFAISETIKWHFIPARSPNFGGLWERAVRSLKNCLFKCVGNCVLSIEEFETVIVQAESALNSRPICQITNDPDNLDVLTPGHFLIGGHLKTLPENSIESSRPLSGRWKMVQDIFRQFWDRWSREYLITLNQRTKNKNKEFKYEVGMVGVLVSENTSPLKWPLGKIVATYPGKDGLVRSVDVKCNRSVYRRGVQKFSVLPNFS